MALAQEAKMRIRVREDTVVMGVFRFLLQKRETKGVRNIEVLSSCDIRASYNLVNSADGLFAVCKPLDCSHNFDLDSLDELAGRLLSRIQLAISFENWCLSSSGSQ